MTPMEPQMTSVPSILIGYFPKRTSRPPDWPGPAVVEEICSACACMTEEPADWINQWKHNDSFLYDSEDLARSMIPATDDPGTWSIFAYRRFPIRFRADRDDITELPKLDVAPLPAGYVSLGYAAVSDDLEGQVSGFQCSPLSCNLRAPDYQVNRHCLLDDREMAFAAARDFASGNAEPGPYYVVEILRAYTGGRTA